VDGYERLRQERLQGVGSRQMAILSDQGMCAWVHAWTERACETADRDGGRVAAKNESGPTGLAGSEVCADRDRGELVELVAAMALSTMKESMDERSKQSKSHCGTSSTQSLFVHSAVDNTAGRGAPGKYKAAVPAWSASRGSGLANGQPGGH